MSIVYAISAGSYSDYRIVAVFSSEEKANEFMRLVPDPDYNGIEVYELDSKVPDLIKHGYSPWFVLMLRDGTTERSERRDIDRFTAEYMDCRIWKRSTASAYRGCGVPDCLEATVWAKTGKQAIKIVNEKRAQLIASGEWD